MLKITSRSTATAWCLLDMPHKEDRRAVPHSQAIGDPPQTMYSQRVSPVTSLPVYSKGYDVYTFRNSPWAVPVDR